MDVRADRGMNSKVIIRAAIEYAFSKCKTQKEYDRLSYFYNRNIYGPRLTVREQTELVEILKKQLVPNINLEGASKGHNGHEKSNAK